MSPPRRKDFKCRPGKLIHDLWKYGCIPLLFQWHRTNAAAMAAGQKKLTTQDSIICINKVWGCELKSDHARTTADQLRLCLWDQELAVESLDI